MSDNRNKILQAASQLFLEGGMSALSVRAIAKRAGVSTIGIYSHFQGKQGILDTLYIEGFKRVERAMELADQKSSRQEKIRAATLAYLAVAEKYGAHYRLIFGESDADYQPSAEAIQVSRDAFSQLLKIVSLFLPTDASIDSQRAAALEIWALVHGFVSLRNHSVSTIMGPADWNKITLEAVEKHLNVMQ